MGVGGGHGLLGHWRGVHLVRGAVGVGDAALVVLLAAGAGEDLLQHFGKGGVVAFAGTGSFDRFALLLRIGTVEVAGSIFAVSRSTLTGFMGGGGLLVQLQKALGEVLRAADAQRGGDGLDGGFGLTDDLALAHLGQLGDHQVIAADVTPGAVLALVGAVDAGVGIAGHIAVGGQLRGLEIDLIAALTGAVGAGGSDLHNVGADDGIALFRGQVPIGLAAAGCLQVSVNGLILCADAGVPIVAPLTLIQLDAAVLLDGVVGNGAGQLVVGALVGVVVPIAAVILVMAAALAAFIIPADLAVQADRLVVLTVDQFSGIVVPLQLQILAYQHTVGLVDLTVLVRQQIQLGTGSEIKVFDVVALLFGVHSVTINTNFMAVSVCIVIIAVPPPSRFPIDLNFGTIRYLAEVFEFTRLFTGVVVLLGLFVIRTLVGNVSGVLGDPLLLLQGLDQLILAHVIGRDGLGEILDDIFLFGGGIDLRFTDPEFLAGLKFALDLLDLLPQLIVCLLKILIVLDDAGDTGGGVHILPDGEGLAQGAVIHGDGFVTLREGRGLAVGVQSDAVSGNTVLACQCGLDLFRGQRSTGLFGEGVGGLYAVFVLDRAGVAVIGFGHIAVDVSVHRNGAGVFVDRPVLAAGDHQLVVKILGVRLCGFRKCVDRPFHALDAGKVHAADINAVTFLKQGSFVLAGLVLQLFPGDLFLLRIGEGSGRFRDRAGTGDLGAGAVGRGHGFFFFVGRGALLRVFAGDRPTIERGKFTAAGLDVGAVEGTALSPRIRAGHISGTGDDVVRDILAGLGVLARIRAARLRRRNRCTVIAEGDSMNIAVCIGIAEIELAFAGGIDRIQLVLEILAVHIDAGFLGGIRQSGLDGFQLGSFLGTLDAFLTAFDLAGGLGDLGDLHSVTQSLADGFHLVKVQLFALVVNAVVIGGEALAQTLGQLRIGERLGVFRFLDFIGIFLAVHVFRIDILAGNVVIVLVLEHFAQLLRRNLDDIRLGLVGVLGSDAWQLDLGGQVLIININSALFLLEHQRGLGAGLDRVAGDLVVGGAGDGVAVLVGRGLFLFQGIGGVALVVGLFLHAALGDIQQLGDVLGGHLLFFGRAGLFQGQFLGVAVLGGLDLVHSVTAQLVILIGAPARTHVLAKLVVEVDLFALLGIGDGGGGIGLAGAGGGRSLGAGGLGGGGDGGVAVLVLAHHGVALLHLGVGVHNGGAGRAVGGLFLGGLADLAVLAGGFVLLTVVDHVTLHIGAVGVLSLVRLAGALRAVGFAVLTGFAGLFRLLSRFIVNGDVIGLGAGAERRGLLFALGLFVHRGGVNSSCFSSLPSTSPSAVLPSTGAGSACGAALSSTESGPSTAWAAMGCAATQAVRATDMAASFSFLFVMIDGSFQMVSSLLRITTVP